ncbi:MAG: DUF4258 domain-containing protein [Geitlerinemataceae cyanobacterium]
MTVENNNTLDGDDLLFELETPLGFSVRTTARYWNLIVTIKHPVMRDRLDDVKTTLLDPDEIRQSRSDSAVCLFYRDDGDRRWLCAVTRRLNGDGFLITAYRTSAIKEGVVLWQK